MYPIPHPSPTAKVKNTYAISFTSPSALLNLIKLKAPAKLNALATLLPTSNIIMEIMAGNIISVATKLLEYPDFL
ncbi:hypothetical protein D3C81_2168210 [compost metagenome]